MPDGVSYFSKPRARFKLMKSKSLIFVVCLFFHLPAIAQQQWLALFVNGQKAGHMHFDRQVNGEEVTTRETSRMSLARSGVPIELSSEDTMVETTAGKPLRFHSVQSLNGSRTEVSGQFFADRVEVNTRSPAGEHAQTVPLAGDVVMSEGLRLRLADLIDQPGAQVSAMTFLPSALAVSRVSLKVGDKQLVDIFETALPLFRLETALDVGQTQMTSTSYVGGDLLPRKLEMDLMGMQVHALACPQACAQAEAAPAEFFNDALVTLPVALRGRELRGAVRYRVESASEAELHFPNSSEQRARALQPRAWEITVDAQASLADEAIADAADFLQPTRWLQSDDPQMKAVAEKVRGGEQDPRKAMAKLERFVARHVNDKNLSVGYASALETLESRSGDCTEHALLLAALGRAAGIPTRIATGMAYVRSWLGSEDVMVPHAWTQALIDGRWVSFDAALGGFDAGHLALAYGNGEPWDFYESVNTLGNFRVATLEVVQ